MLVRQKSPFYRGLIMAIGFLVILFLMFSPLFGGKNSLEAADILFNSMAKGSTNYFAGLAKKAGEYTNKPFDVNLKLKDAQMAQQMSKVLSLAGAKVSEQAAELKVSGDLGAVLSVGLKDSEAMFRNKEGEVSTKYGFSGQETLYLWWNAFKEMDKDLKRQKQFKEAALLGEVVKKGVEVAYHFAHIEPESASSKMGILVFSLVFYVIYTLWWGLAVLFLFEGIGLEMKAGAKKEV